LVAEEHRFRWLVKGLLADGSYGVVGGAKKSLKSYVAMATAIGVASGEPVLGTFEVPEARPVKLYVGEGGRGPAKRRLERVAEAMGVDLAGLPLIVQFETASILSDEFAEWLREDLDADPKPGLVILDPFYPFHGGGDGASNLYSRTEKLGAFSGPCADAGVAGLIVDHFNKSGDGRGLDRLTQAGMGEWADSWLLLTHREAPEVAAGRFRLLMEVGSRQWGGREHDVDLDLGRFDDDLADHDGEVRWRVAPHVEQPRRTTIRDVEGEILQIISDQPFELTKTQIIGQLGGKKGDRDAAFARMELNGVIKSKDVALPDASGQSRTRTRWGLA
jgi:hypothetical protein